MNLCWICGEIPTWQSHAEGDVFAPPRHVRVGPQVKRSAAVLCVCIQIADGDQARIVMNPLLTNQKK